jgi:hypothetical protein
LTTGLFCGGAMSRARFERLLGLSPALGFHVAAVRLEKGRVHVEVARTSPHPPPMARPAPGAQATARHGERVAAPERYELVFGANRDDFEGLFRGAFLSVWFQGDELPPPLLARLRQRTFPALSRLRMADFERALRLDPELAATTSPRRSPDDPRGPAEGRAGGAPHDWQAYSVASAGRRALDDPHFYADFFAAPEFWRAGCYAIDSFADHTFLLHGDFECSYCAINVPAPRYHLVRLPVHETVRNIGRLRGGRAPFEESSSLVDTWSSDISETDVILGKPGRFDELLARGVHARQKDHVMCVGLCLPDVIGMDVERTVTEFTRATAAPLLFVPPAPRSWDWLTKDLLATRRKRLEGSGAARDSRAVNLIGFGENRGTATIAALLARFGVRVNAHLLPKMTLSAVERLPRAALDVYAPNVFWQKAYAHLQDESPRPALVAHAPYGYHGTKRWLEDVLALLDPPSGDDIDGILADFFAPWRSHYDALCREAARHRLGFVVPCDGLHLLLDAAHTWGIPLLETVREFGFGVDVFVGGRHPDEVARALATLAREAPAHWQANWELRPFLSLAELLAALAASPAAAVFSHYVFDWRLSRSGKMPFSTVEFEMGPAGAVWSLERLLTACRTPLYRRFAKYFPAPPGLAGSVAHQRSPHDGQ